MRVTVDKDKCRGAGQCVLIAPGIFDQRDDDGIVVLLGLEPEPDELSRASVREAAQVRPAAAITLDVS
ncbi:ferredoxin [Streptomyces sp. AK02-01A]|uniref:ferredoxin n=1 Tax=Streptomyces sp. AK02-01A TaxID=3028648 RepID=UPI0029B733CD|nr:ferredoxin [Streptomyces sp. AK02-01A]MDX3850209.1 ferredoxin [Streptomyces sp. AK02-01A]